MELAVKEKKKTTPHVYGKALNKYGLTAKQLRFVEEYIKNGGIATQAAFAAYDLQPHQERTAQSIGSENLSKPLVRDAIREVLNKQFASPEFVVANFYRLATTAKHEETQKSATDSLAKVHGMFKETKDVNTTVNVVQIGLPSNEGRKIVDAVARNVANVSGE